MENNEKQYHTIESISAVLVFLFMLVFLYFVTPTVYRKSLSFVNNITTTEKEYVTVEVTDIQPNSDIWFIGLDNGETVRVRAYSIEDQNVHVGDKLKVKKYKSRLDRSNNDNGYLYWLEDDNEKR